MCSREMEIDKDMKFFTRGIMWRNNAVFPLGDYSESEDILYLTEKGRAGVIKKASMRGWRWLVDKYHIKYWTYLKDLQF